LTILRKLFVSSLLLYFRPPWKWAGLGYAALTAMKSVTFNAVKNGNGYVKAMIAPANRSKAGKADTVGMVLAGGLLVITAAFLTVMLLAL
jgi:hypothetical protein